MSPSCKHKSWDTAVDIAKRLWTESPRNSCSTPSRSKWSVSSVKRPDRFWCPPSHWTIAYRMALYQEIKRPGRECNNLLPFRAEFKNKCSNTSTPLISSWRKNRQLLLYFYLKILVSLRFFPRLNIYSYLAVYLLYALTSTNICRPGSTRLFSSFQLEQQLKVRQLDTIVDIRGNMTT